MLLENVSENYEGLISLWNEAFGDSEEYISLLFSNANIEIEKPEDKKEEIFKCFVEFSDGKIVSALYLLKSRIRLNKTIYNGYYLYAAATLEEYRGKRIMANLIEEAKAFATQEKADFISLVPCNDSLYDYYSKFDFQKAMYRYSASVNCKGNKKNFKLPSIKKYNPLRNIAAENVFFFGKDATAYCAKCLNYSGSKMIFSDDFYAIVSDDESTVIEFLSIIDDYNSTFKKLLQYFSGKIKIYSPYDFSADYNSKKEPFGMIFPIHESLKRSYESDDIYMNLALD